MGARDCGFWMIFDGWTASFLVPSFSGKRLEILKRVFTENGGTIESIDACDQSGIKKFEQGKWHIVLADARPDQDLHRIFTDCLNFDIEQVDFYSADWVPESIKAKKVLDVTAFIIKAHHEPKRAKVYEESTFKTLLPEGFINSHYECMRPTPLDHKNKGLVAELGKIAHHRYLAGNSRSELSYNRAIAVLKSYPKDIESAEEAEELQGIGPKITGLIGEYIATGKIRTAAELESDPEMKVLDLLTKIHGVGPRTAQTWYQLGIRTLDELREAVDQGNIQLKEDQKIGLLYYEDFIQTLSRADVEEILKIVQEAGKRIFGDRVVIEMTGGYRRGKVRSGDADILIHPIRSSPSPSEILEKLISALSPRHIKAIMTHSKSTKGASKDASGLDVCLMAFQVAPGSVMRRVDFIVSPMRSYPFAMLGWTGSRQFERSIRLYAQKEHGMTLTEHSLIGRRGDVHEFKDEKEIFAFLGVPYVEPYYRNC